MPGLPRAVAFILFFCKGGKVPASGPPADDENHLTWKGEPVTWKGEPVTWR
ncbi:MAG: hypothetical protein OXF78_09395 [Rhodospirillales bacterium]|nr:hypothetical protein [Rhodospirillales bacterium]